MGGKVFFVVCGCFFSKWGKLCTSDVYSHKKLIAAVKALRNEASLLQRLADRSVRKGVEQLLGLAEYQISGDGKLLRAPYESDADQGNGKSSILSPDS